VMAIGGATAAWPVRRKPRADDADANGPAITTPRKRAVVETGAL
jgi:hypothetical protein